MSGELRESPFRFVEAEGRWYLKGHFDRDPAWQTYIYMSSYGTFWCAFEGCHQTKGGGMQEFTKLFDAQEWLETKSKVPPLLECKET